MARGGNLCLVAIDKGKVRLYIELFAFGFFASCFLFSVSAFINISQTFYFIKPHL